MITGWLIDPRRATPTRTLFPWRNLHPDDEKGKAPPGYSPKWIVKGRVQLATFKACVVCEGLGYGVGDDFDFYEGWRGAMELAHRELVLVVCKECWSSCPLLGALSFADGHGGELTIFSTGHET